MKHLFIPFTQPSGNRTSAKETSRVSDRQEWHSISSTPWAAYNYLPDVSFAVSHCNDAIILTYSVSENYTQARFHAINDPVYNDSCVEFFISFNMPYYYNLEFNCLGIAMIGYGKNRSMRDLLQEDIIRTVRSYPTLKPGFDEGPRQWQLTVMIAVDVFCYDNISSLEGMQAHANFYKCGEQLPQRHYCAWNAIDSPKPNFHLPEYFGSIVFA